MALCPLSAAQKSAQRAPLFCFVLIQSDAFERRVSCDDANKVFGCLETKMGGRGDQC